jgi:hypothetical protein
MTGLLEHPPVKHLPEKISRAPGEITEQEDLQLI